MCRTSPRIRGRQDLPKRFRRRQPGKQANHSRPTDRDPRGRSSKRLGAGIVVARRRLGLRKAAVENGADAVYFGLQNGLNARAKAANFDPAELGRLMAFLRVRGVKGYLAVNTLVFRDELAEAERTVRLAVEAGVDALLIQDLALLRLAHRLCPELPLHASTQMTLTDAECIEEVIALGVRRVILPRELSIEQIATVRRQTGVEVEVFVHGALCVSYSGQCLASLALGDRSANRGRCAEPCRLPYEVLCADETLPCRRPYPKYPISPHDLAAYDRVRN